MDRLLRSVRLSHVLVGTFFAALLLVGIAVCRDYGIPWDEKTQYSIGLAAYESLIQGKPWTTYADWRYFGTTFELLLTGIEMTFFFTAHARTVFIMRHFVTFLSFYAGVAFFFPLALRFFKHWSWALIACLLLVLSPRVFGHAFYNSKDIPSMSLFIVCIYTMLLFLKERTWAAATVHAFTSALLVTIRMTAMFVLGLTILFLALDALSRFRATRERPWHSMMLGAAYLAVWAAVTVILWPYLWDKPLQHFGESLLYMGNKAAGGLYLGAMMEGAVWHWVPVWIAVTTPFLYTAFFLVGTIAALRRLPERRIESVALAWFFLPLLAIVVSGAGLYDDWRHVFFLYPAFILLSVGGMRWAWTALGTLHRPSPFLTRTFMASLIVFTCVSTAGWMVTNHPFQSLYFSIPARYADGNFELDYWGITFRKGIEYLLEHDRSPVVFIYVAGSPGWSAPNILSREQRKRVALTTDPMDAQYILDNFRTTQYQKTLPERDKVHAVTAGGIEVLGIYRNFQWQGKMPTHNFMLWPEDGIYLFIGKTGDHPMS